MALTGQLGRADSRLANLKLAASPSSIITLTLSATSATAAFVVRLVAQLLTRTATATATLTKLAAYGRTLSSSLAASATLQKLTAYRRTLSPSTAASDDESVRP